MGADRPAAAGLRLVTILTLAFLLTLSASSLRAEGPVPPRPNLSEFAVSVNGHRSTEFGACGRDMVRIPVGVVDPGSFLAAALEVCPSLSTVVIPVAPGSHAAVPAALADQAHGAGLRVLVGISFFAAALEGTAVGSDPPAARGLIECPRDVPCRGLREGPFLSPWAPQVARDLVACAAALGRQSSEVDGVCLDVRLSCESWWGFSNAARSAYIAHAGIDPLDLPLGRVPPERHPQLRAWMEWRLETVGKLLRRVTRVLKLAQPGARVALVCSPQSPGWPLSDRARVLEDWLPWCLDGLIDDLVFEVDLGARNPAEDVQCGCAIADKLGLGARVWVRCPGAIRGTEVPMGDLCSRLAALMQPRLPLLLEPLTEEQFGLACSRLALCRPRSEGSSR